MTQVEKTDLVLPIVLSIVTCGIYLIYWEYKTWETLYRVTNQPSTAGMDVLLSIVTCNIYGIYMLYKAGQMEVTIQRDYNLPEKDNSMLYLLLAIFTGGLVSMCILQHNINTMADHINANTQIRPE